MTLTPNALEPLLRDSMTVDTVVLAVTAVGDWRRALPMAESLCFAIGHADNLPLLLRVNGVVLDGGRVTATPSTIEVHIPAGHVFGRAGETLDETRWLVSPSKDGRYLLTLAFRRGADIGKSAHRLLRRLARRVDKALATNTAPRPPAPTRVIGGAGGSPLGGGCVRRVAVGTVEPCGVCGKDGPSSAASCGACGAEFGAARPMHAAGPGSS